MKRLFAFIMRHQLLLAGMLAFIVITWYSMAMIDYDLARPTSYRQPAGWFFIGFFFMLGLGVLYGLIFVGLAKWQGPFCAWILLISLSAIWLAREVRGSTLSARLDHFIPDELLKHSVVLRAKVMDSFNDGQVIQGILWVPPGYGDHLLNDPQFSAERLSYSYSIINSGTFPGYPEIIDGPTLAGSWPGFRFQLDEHHNLLYFIGLSYAWYTAKHKKRSTTKEAP